MNIYNFLLLFCVDSSISHLSPRQVFCGTKIEQVFIFWIFRGTQGKKQYHQKQHYSYIYPKDHSHCRINTHCKGELQSIPQFCVLLCDCFLVLFVVYSHIVTYPSYSLMQPWCRCCSCSCCGALTTSFSPPPFVPPSTCSFFLQIPPFPF